MAKSFKGSKKIGGVPQEPKNSPNPKQVKGYGGGARISGRNDATFTAGGEVHPQAYGGAPTSMRRPKPPKKSGSGDGTGAGSTSTNPWTPSE
jgi:hypothetical protein